MKTAVFLDLDGTLWEWGVVPESAQEAVRRAQANGHKILTNTGRARSEVPDMAYLGLDGFCFAAGAEVLLDGMTIVDERIAQLGNTPDPIMNAPLVQDMPPEQWKHIHKAFYHGGNPIFAEVAAAMPKGVSLTELMPGIAEATAAGVTKATAMEAVRTYLGADEWRTMACGDSDNDLTMLRAADVSVAMGNGNDNAKAAATWVTTDIHNDGLLNAFAHYDLFD